MATVVTQTRIPGAPEPYRGKVRDVYDLGETLLMVASDRISAFDVVLPTPVPDKGRVLNRISEFWFDKFRSVVRNHVVETDVARFPEPFSAHAEILRDRSMLVTKTKRVDVECVARGYLVGSGWVEYQKSGSVCGVPLPAGLQQAERLPSPIFTPAAKADVGHDENISFTRMVEMVGEPLAAKLRDLTIDLFGRASEHAESCGLILADTKFEFGLAGDEVVWIDEALTPDSSRFWPRDEYRVGTSPVSFDKQFVRDHLLAAKWNKEPPAPELPADVVENTRRKYLEAYRLLTGRELS